MQLSSSGFRRSLAALCLSLLVAGTALAQSGEGFFSAIEDLPLAPGMSEALEQGLTFDRPDGRIVTAIALGESEPDAVAAFYRETLPSLGWQITRQPGLSFRRAGEALEIEIGSDPDGGLTRLMISLTPLNAGASR